MSQQTAPSISDLVPDQILRFQALFRRFSADLDGALQRASVHYEKHMPSKGEVCEAAVRRYLCETLGNRYAVANGFAFDSQGNESQELDAIIFDDHWSVRLTPRDSNEPPYIPVESVYAAIQVKKTLSSADLRDAIDNLSSLKMLTRETVTPEFVAPNRRIQGLGKFSSQKVRNPYFTAIFAFSAGRSRETVLEQLKAEVIKRPPELWPDVIVLHKEGVILPFCQTCNTSANHIQFIASEGHELTYILDHLDGAYSLLGFHLLLMHHLHFSILAPPDFNQMYGILAEAARLLRHIAVNRCDSDES
jgi:hypothetical protein